MKFIRQVLAVLAGAFLFLSIAPLAVAEATPWVSSGNLTVARSSHTATLLPNGKVLVCGGYNYNNDTNTGALASAEIYDPATGKWTTTGSLATARYIHTATMLPNGKVLVCGGLGINGNYLSSAELYDPASGTWTTAGSMATERYYHSATLLPNGKVLVCGGETSHYLASAELYDAATGSWSPTGYLKTARGIHTSTLLPNGKVLVCGGDGGNLLASAELYDPDTEIWSSTGSMATPRYLFTATLLPNGKVLVCGGSGYSGNFASAELYDPATGTWSSTSSMPRTHYLHSATLLPNGKVLVAGGYDSTKPQGTLANAELYDPATGTWATTGTLATERDYHTATLLPDGKVLICGGGNNYTARLASTELYGTSTGSWSSTGNMAVGRDVHTATLLTNGKVLVAGGGAGVYLASAEIYDPVSGTWTTTGGLAAARSYHTATLLPNGKVLVTGGYNAGTYLASAEIYDPQTGTWSSTGSLATERCQHTATLLPNGKVLVCGGGNSNRGLASAEVYDPATGTWSTTGTMATTRYAHSATLLPNGKVLVTGGYDSGGGFFVSAEIYDVTTGTWSTTGRMPTASYDYTATLLPNGKVLVCGEGAFDHGPSAQLYDIATGTWSTTASMATARLNPTATLLPNGKVLMAAGYNRASGPRTSTELYDPATGMWSPSGSMATARQSHMATLLPNGKLMVTGGFTSNFPANTELYDIGLDFPPSWQPQINSASFNAKRQLVLSGSRFRGFSGGSGGNTQDSPTNYPVVQLRWLDSGQISYLSPDPGSSASDIAFTSTAGAQDRIGCALVTVYVGGIPSSGMVTAPFSTDANLGSLNLIGVTLNSHFDPTVTSYTATVANAVSTVSLNASSAFPAATILQTPANPVRLAVGNNTFHIQVTAQDGVTIKTYTITVNRMEPDMALLTGVYQALLVPDGGPSLGTTGLVTVTLKATGAFSGKAALGGVSIPFIGRLKPDGTAQFNPTQSTSFNLVDKTHLNRRLGSLAFSVSEGDGVIGTLQSSGGSVLANFTGKAAPYGPISPVPVALLNQPAGPTPTKGVYTVVFPAKAQPALDPSDYPQGDGFATLTLNANGDIRLAGYLADGTKYSAAAKLRADATVPLFTQLYKKQGAMAGELAFADRSDSDVSGAEFIWLRPQQPEASYYPAGWPHGMSLDVIGAKYAAPASFDFGQGSANLIHGNAMLTMSDGRLTSSMKKAISLNPANGAVRLVSPTSTGNYSLTLSPRTGQFQGTFTHDGVSDTYRGILLNKGLNQGGFGYFLNSYPVWWGFSSEGGGVSLEPKDSTSSSNTSGSQGLTKTGPGTLVLGGTNNYNGSSIGGGSLSPGATGVTQLGGN